MASAYALTVSMTNPFADDSGKNVITLDWTSADSGQDVSLNIASTYATAQALINDALPQPSKIKGYIKAIETIPGALGIPGTNPPTNLYDITLDDPYNYDVAGGSLADRSSTLPQKVIPSAPIPIDSEITLEVSTAGLAKQGRILIYIDPLP